jgi:hypothetical protein
MAVGRVWGELVSRPATGGEDGVRERGIRIDPKIAEKLRALGYMK